MPTPPLPENEVLYCQFYSPRTWENLEPTSKTDIWNYSEWNCWSGKSELIQNSETSAEFYVEKTLNYGDALILWFLTIFLIGYLFKFAYNFFWKK